MQNIVCYYSQRNTRKPKITLTCLINERIGNLIILVPRAFSVDEGEIRAFDWLKPPISTLLTHILFGFSCFAFEIWLLFTRSLITVQA